MKNIFPRVLMSEYLETLSELDYHIDYTGNTSIINQLKWKRDYLKSKMDQLEMQFLYKK